MVVYSFYNNYTVNSLFLLKQKKRIVFDPICLDTFQRWKIDDPMIIIWELFFFVISRFIERSFDSIYVILFYKCHL